MQAFILSIDWVSPRRPFIVRDRVQPRPHEAHRVPAGRSRAGQFVERDATRSADIEHPKHRRHAAHRVDALLNEYGDENSGPEVHRGGGARAGARSSTNPRMGTSE